MDLFCLYCLVNKKEANLGTILLPQFVKGKRQGAEAKLELGTYVTRITIANDVFERYLEPHLTVGPATEPFDVDSLKLTGVVEIDEPIRWKTVKMSPQVLPPGGTPAAEAMQAGHRTRRQVVVLRLERPRSQHPLRPPRPDLLTLEMVYDTMIDGIAMQSNMMRYMLEQQHIAVPDWFPPHQPVQPSGGDEHMQDPHDEGSDEE
ncbi:hypothetical protein HanPSC8_Chr10g0430081 [Helianthus annuus]|nr:hypothetical protein HanPSC8_Chr10g0430081 [Helianthus annuus]